MSLTLWLVGAIPLIRTALVIAAQILGGIAAAGVVSALFPGPLPVNVRLGGGTSVTQGLFIEMFTTTQLVFAVIMLAAVKHKATFLAPLGIGLALFIGHLCSQYWAPMLDGTGSHKLPYLTLSRCILHWSRDQPSTCLWARCSQPFFSWLSLDLLARPGDGIYACGGILSPP